MKKQNLIFTDEELAQAKKDAYNDALDKIEYNSGEPTFGDGWCAAISYIRKKSVITRKQQKPKPVWSEEDEEKLVNTTISFLNDYADKGYENAIECIDWLKSLKERLKGE